MALSLVVLSAVGTSASTAQDDTDESRETFVGFGRVDRPQDPFAIAFPDDWEVYAYGPVQQEADARRGSELLRRPTEGLGQPSELSITGYGPPAPDGRFESCTIEIWASEGASLPRLERDFVRDAAWSFGDVLTAGPDSRTVELSTGPTVRVDASMSFADGSPGVMTWYLFDDGEVYAPLGCFGPERPADAWMAIAESFRFRAGTARAGATDPSTDHQPDPTLPLFPSHAQVGDVLGLEVETSGSQDGSSQVWEGASFDWQSLPSARTQTYVTRPDEPPLTGVIIDIAQFDGADEAALHVAEIVGDGAVEDVMGLDADFAATVSLWPDGGMAGSYVVVRDGRNIVLVTVITGGAMETESVAARIAALVLRRLPRGS